MASAGIVSERPDIFWIGDVGPARLAMMPCPPPERPLIDTVALWKTAGISLVICLLEEKEAQNLGLCDEPAACMESGIEFVGYPIKDRGIPVSVESVHGLAAMIVSRLNGGEAVAIHCRGGIGRTGMVAGAVLMLLGYSAADSIRALTRARGVNVPQTRAQEEWMDRFGMLVAP
jgi:protein-tyrosine phosphatase